MATNVIAFKDRPETLRGRTAELLIARELMKRGWLVNPAYAYSASDTKAPRLEGWAAHYILPDLDVCRRGVRRWVEVKAKASATRTVVASRRCWAHCELEHGIDMRLIREYQAVRQHTGNEVWICIYEEDTRLGLFANLTDIEKQGNHRYAGDATYGSGGMYYFPRDLLDFRLAIEPVG